MIVKQLVVFFIIMWASKYLFVDYLELEGGSLMFWTVIAFFISAILSGIAHIKAEVIEND